MADEHKDHDEHGGKGHGGGGHGGGGHGGGHAEGEHEGAPEWLISFADNVMLQMGFFVILLALNMKPASGGAGSPNQPEQGGLPPALLDGFLSIREAFNNPVDPQSDDPNEQPLVHRLREKLSQGAGPADENSTVGKEKETKSIRPSDYLGMGGKIMFADGATELDADAQNDIRQLCNRLRGRQSIVEVHGHVSTAEAYGRDDRGMHLSYERAWIVASALSECGVSWSQLQLISAADTDRINAIAYDLSAHRVNQRVEVIVTDRSPSSESNAPRGSESPSGAGKADEGHSGGH
ncbi:MAG: OmpA family protein [Phycisphaerales bacterium]|nr:OmpA family protein [Phycisphaerales bacterium]